VSKVRVSWKGIRSGGKSFSRGALYELLSNPLYIGQISHKQERHPGQHEPIVKRELWDEVQQRLREGTRRSGEAASKALSSPLAGKAFDEQGEPLYAQGAAKGGRRYRYFVSRALVKGASAEGRRGWRVPALELERAVLAAARLILADQAALVASINNAPESAGDVERMLAAAANWRERLGRKDEARGALAELIQRVQLAEAGLRVTLNVPAASTGAGQGGGMSLSQFVPLTMRRRGVELRLILDGHGEKRRQLDPALLKALARARCWFEEVACGRVGSLAAMPGARACASATSRV
jgi:site-specific DNA recombinase